jgi:hypothetical protein
MRIETCQEMLRETVSQDLKLNLPGAGAGGVMGLLYLSIFGNLIIIMMEFKMLTDEHVIDSSFT